MMELGCTLLCVRCGLHVRGPPPEACLICAASNVQLQLLVQHDAGYACSLFVCKHNRRWWPTKGFGCNLG
jgi:hypothetical protein